MDCAYADQSAKVGGLALGLADWLSVPGIREQSRPTLCWPAWPTCDWLGKPTLAARLPRRNSSMRSRSSRHAAMLVLLVVGGARAELPSIRFDRITPLGGAAGSTVEVQIAGAD